ncbi:MAG: TPR repeat protein [Arenicella sp.]|jgi:TPR repeat protein
MGYLLYALFTEKGAKLWLTKLRTFEQMFGLTETLNFFFSLNRNNKKQFVSGIVSLIILISGLCSFQVLAQTDLPTNIEKPETEQEYLAELDRWMLTAFEGDPQAQYRVGMLHTNAEFKQADFEQAAYWYRQAAIQGHVLAQYNLGHQYLLGVGVNKNEASAMKWWLEAAKQNHALAQFNIGRAYYLGIGLQQDHKQSQYWFSRAAGNNEPKSIEILTKLGWAEGPVAADFDPNTNPDVMTTLHGRKKPNPVSQLKIKEARDRRATPNLKSKITPIDPSKITSAAAKPKLGDVTRETKTKDDAQSVAIKALAKASSPKLRNSPELESSTLNIAKNKTRPGNLTLDEQQAEKMPLNKTVATEPSENSLTIKPLEKPALINNNRPVAVYTNPRIRSVLIAIIDDRTDLKIAKAGSQWSSVKSSAGIPVWMHGDYLKLDRALPSQGSVLGSVTGDNVNARSVPIVSTGTLVGRLNKGERLSVIEKRDDWYRVIGPTRFIAWVKTPDLGALAVKAEPEVKAELGVKATPVFKQAASKPDSRPRDDEWLFLQNASDFTLQLGSFVGVAKTQDYLKRIELSQRPNLHQLGSKTGGKQRTVFVFGAYKSRQLAENTKLKMKQEQAWVRTLGGLQKNRCKQWQEQQPIPEEHQRYCKK